MESYVTTFKQMFPKLTYLNTALTQNYYKYQKHLNIVSYGTSDSGAKCEKRLENSHEKQFYNL